LRSAGSSSRALHRTALLIDERGFITEANPLAIHYLGLGRFWSLQRMLIYRLFDSETRARLHGLLKEHAASGPQALVEVTIKLSDGDEQVCDLARHPSTGTRPKPLLRVLTGSKRPMGPAPLAKSAGNATALANLATANAFVWDWDLLTQEIWWSQAFEPLFGYRAGELPPVYETWQSRARPPGRTAAGRGRFAGGARHGAGPVVRYLSLPPWRRDLRHGRGPRHHQP
jgi:PAS domain-containing protein